MSSSKHGITRRGFGTALICSGLAGCGFQPVYQSGGPSDMLFERTSVSEPKSRLAFYATQRLEEILGQNTQGAYVLTPTFRQSTQSLGTTSDGTNSRINLIGSARVTLARADDQAQVLEFNTSSFTGYSTTASTVATAASQKDAEERLARILADRIIDQLTLNAADILAKE